MYILYLLFKIFWKFESSKVSSTEDCMLPIFTIYIEINPQISVMKYTLENVMFRNFCSIAFYKLRNFIYCLLDTIYSLEMKFNG